MKNENLVSLALMPNFEDNDLKAEASPGNQECPMSIKIPFPSGINIFPQREHDSNTCCLMRKYRHSPQTAASHHVLDVYLIH